MDLSYGIGDQIQSHKPSETERFYKSVMAKVGENTKKLFLANGVSERVHDKLIKKWRAKTDEADVYGSRAKKYSTVRNNTKNSYITDESLDSNRVSEAPKFTPMTTSAPFLANNYEDIKRQQAQASIGFTAVRPIQYNPNTQGTAFTRVNSNRSMANSSQISATKGPLPGRLPSGVMNLNFSVKTNPVKVKKTEDTTKRMPAKKGYGRQEPSHKFKNDGQNDDGEGEDDDEEEDDPDLALFNELEKKKSAGSPKDTKSPSLVKKSSKQTPAQPAKPSFEFPNFSNSIKSTPKADVKQEPKEESKTGGGEIKFELTSSNLKKHEEAHKEGLKRSGKGAKEEIGENLSEVTLSEQDIETTDYIFGQYIKVNRTKQRYRCEFADVILHISGTDYIIKKLHAEINGQ